MIYYDFGFYLTIGAVVTGVIALIDKLKWSKEREAKGREYDEKGHEVLPFAIDISRSMFPIIFGVLILRSFLYEPYRIPSGSMNPGLYDGDFILVNKYAYGIRLPVTNTQIIPVGEPQRGDVIVFHPPNLDDPTKAIQPAYIKRLYGLPGDTLTWNRGILTIETKCLPEQKCEKFVIKPELVSTEVPELVDQSRYQFDLYQQDVLGNQHELLFVDKKYRGGAHDQQWQVTLPEGKYFAMGDHRDNSRDARAWYEENSQAFIDREAIIGRAAAKWLFMTFTDEPVLFGWHLPKGISFGRVGAID
ncbi:signal peptidase I [Kangiella sp. TOML190]|uniref:signal peptidase I n=1 Tax=Kangiella sp. TOML190 TaxID=2931351 RepID=UPI00203AAB97|nr:signal peptidase I [Kangiella sp. TOML190]